MSNTDKKASHYCEYPNLSGQVSASATYGVMPEALNDYRVPPYYAASFPYGYVYDNRLVYMQTPQGYNIQTSQDNLNKNKRPVGMTNQYYDPKSVQGEDMNMTHLQYVPQYTNGQSSIAGYPTMITAPQYQLNQMMQQGMMFSYAQPSPSLKRDIPTQNLYSINDKSSKKQAVQQPQQRVQRVSHYGVMGQPMTTPIMQVQGKPVSMDYSRIATSKYMAQPSRSQVTPQPPSVKQEVNNLRGTFKIAGSCLDKATVTDMERTVATILCGMKGTTPLPTQSPAQGSTPVPSQPLVQMPMQQSVQQSVQLPTQMSMQQPIQQLPQSQPPQPSNPSPAPQATSPEVVPPAFTQVLNSVVPSALSTPSVKSEGIPPIPSPPQTLLPPTMNPMSYTSEASGKEVEKSEETHDSSISIIPPLDPEQLLFCRMPVACRPAVSKSSTAPAEIPSVLPTAESGSVAVSEGTQLQQASIPSSLPQSASEQSTSTQEPSSQQSSSQLPTQPTLSEGVDQSQKKSGEEERVPLVPTQENEEETVPLVHVPTDQKQDDTDGVPLTHVVVLKKPEENEVRQDVPK